MVCVFESTTKFFFSIFLVLFFPRYYFVLNYLSVFQLFSVLMGSLLKVMYTVSILLMVTLGIKHVFLLYQNSMLINT